MQIRKLIIINLRGNKLVNGQSQDWVEDISYPKCHQLLKRGWEHGTLDIYIAYIIPSLYTPHCLIARLRELLDWRMFSWRITRAHKQQGSWPESF